MELFRIFGKVVLESQDATEELEEIRNKAKNTSEGFEDVDDKAKKLANGGFTILKGAAANLLSDGFRRLISAMGKFVSNGVDYQMTLEQYSTSFEVMTGSAEKAAEITERLSEIAATTPFSMSDVSNATQLLINYGISADDAVDKMMMLGDIAQGSSDKMNRIATAYGQMSSSGKVLLEDVKQMIEAGFNPLQQISSSTGESMDSLYERISKGTLEVEEVTAAMEQATSKGGQYFNSMDKQAETLSGRLSTLKDTANESMGNILLPLLQKAADDWIPKLTEVVEQMDEKFAQFGEKVSEYSPKLKKFAEIALYATGVFIAFKAAMAIQKTVQGIQSAKVALSLLSMEIGGANLAQAALNGTLTVGETIVGLLTGKIKLATLAQGLMAKGQAALNAVLSANPIALIIVGIAALVAAFMYLWNNCEGFRNFWIGLWDGIKVAAKSVADWFVLAWTDVGNFFTKTVPGWFNSFKIKAANVFNAVKSAITNPIEAAKDTVESVVDKIKEFFDFKVQLPEIQLPHFSISPDGWQLGDLLKGSIPKLGIEWYAKGGVFDEPTIFPTARGLKGVGEAGAEAVAPIDVLQGYVAAAVASQNKGLILILQRILDAILEMDANMGGYLREALDGASLKVNRREFFRLVRGAGNA